MVVTSEHLARLTSRLTFGFDNRAGMDGSLHRISVMRGRDGSVTGATLRMGG